MLLSPLSPPPASHMTVPPREREKRKKGGIKVGGGRRLLSLHTQPATIINNPTQPITHKKAKRASSPSPQPPASPGNKKPPHQPTARAPPLTDQPDQPILVLCKSQVKNREKVRGMENETMGSTSSVILVGGGVSICSVDIPGPSDDVSAVGSIWRQSNRQRRSRPYRV